MAKARKGINNLIYAAAAAVVVAVAAWLAFGFFSGAGSEFIPDPNFDADTVRAQIEELEDFGNGHVTTKVEYATEFPASGDHAPSPVPPGFYEDPIITEALVHSLEHGYIVFYYDDPGSAALTQIRDWTIRYQGNWDGVVAVPYQGLGAEIVMTAWARRLHLAEFSADAAWVFIDEYRGRGPENPVR